MQYDSDIMPIYQPSIRSFPTGEYDLPRQGLFLGFIEPELESFLWNGPNRKVASSYSRLATTRLVALAS